MTTLINDVEVAHSQALIYEEIQDARLKALFGGIRKTSAEHDPLIAEMRKQGHDEGNISEAIRDFDESAIQYSREITKDIIVRWLVPYGGTDI